MRKVYKIIAVFILILITGVLSFMHYIDRSLDEKGAVKEVPVTREIPAYYTKIF
ncbi:hypothetical protein [Sinomicrobium weinanense]|uniref:Uncharacterized protein n=1 Tax=Sinomicrobium weinanense TaxID=2842200 RepID=A0A926Q3U0_9FLAO|nr:hypothetical protein [Sinomicrobium weinanense]MBC9797274.1 hypothetical protein [Sinomicrobium weinanense]MBU3125407.1 hypothetical protein [Sinomicrobium weinanense]